MADTRSKEARSKNMAAIHSKDTKPEVFLRSLLFKNGYRFRKYCKALPGHPDIWLKKYNTVIFVNGCFWHRHEGCKYAYIPKSRTDFWLKKFERNVNRDKLIHDELLKQNHKCLVIWECTLKKTGNREERIITLLSSINDFLNSNEMYREM